MSASTDSQRRPAAWSAGGVLMLLVLAAGLAAGLWPRAIYPAEIPPAGPQLPTLQALAVAHATWVLLGWPLVLGRWGSVCGARFARGAIFQLVVHLLVAAPLYALAAWFSDATVLDVVRVVGAIVLLCPLGAAAGQWYARERRGAWCVQLGVLMLTLGLPGVYYLWAEFFSAAGDGQWLWDLGPLTHVWSGGASRVGRVFARPLWAGGVQAGMGVVLGLSGVIVRPGSA